MEEVVQTLVEEGALGGTRGNYRLETTPAELHISPTVQGVLAARIDRLTTEEKTLLQQLAVIGRQFPVSLVKHVVEQPEADLYRIVSSLQAKEFLYEQPAFPESEYIFKHALTQDVAYGSVLQEQRKVLHARTGQALEALYAEKLDDHYSELAHHYERSDNIEKAVEYLRLAGQQAVQRATYEEAVRFLTTALEFLKTLPETRVRNQKELELLITLGASLGHTVGYTAPQIRGIYTRAQALCQQVGDAAQLFPVFWGLWIFHYLRGDLQTGRAWGEQLLGQAQQAQDPYLLAQAHYVLGASILWLGEMTACYEQTEQGLVAYNSHSHHKDASLAYGWDPGVACLSYSALSLHLRGHPEQAQERLQEALTLAQKVTHPAGIGFALAWQGMLAQWSRNPRAVQDCVETFRAFLEEHGMGSYSTMGEVQQGWALIRLGQAETGVTHMQQVLAADRAKGLEWARPYSLALLAEGYAAVQRENDGLYCIAEALERVEQTGERWYEAELYRLKGELLLQQSHEQQAEAEACFHTALDIARQQQAKSWELRAATSLARLWQQQGKIAEARDLIAPIYDWFTEGFDTQDLKDAKTLLDALESGKEVERHG